jgi:hypothetical protein
MSFEKMTKNDSCEKIKMNKKSPTFSKEFSDDEYTTNEQNPDPFV